MSAGVIAILDVTWHQSSEIAALISEYGIAYFHLDVSVRPFVSALTKYLRARDATDAILIFQNENGKCNINYKEFANATDNIRT